MITNCPICNNTSFELVWSVDKSPLLLLVEADTKLAPDYFAQLEVVGCTTCGHMFNRQYDSALWDRMYKTDIITNTPVAPSMFHYLEDIADWVGRDRLKRATVIEVGSGSGHLARIISREADSVLVFEPSAGLTSVMLPESNITLINEPFSCNLVTQPADLIICRQVLEHVANPAYLMDQMRRSLLPDGLLYLEIPTQEFIIEHAAFFDLHLAHVQYFCRNGIRRLASSLGLEVLAEKTVKSGHDYCAIMTRRSDHSKTDLTRPAFDMVKPEVFFRNLDLVKSMFDQTTKPLALYGATWQTVGLISALGLDAHFDIVFDDNQLYYGKYLYNEFRRIPICEMITGRISELNSIIVTAYLHEMAISQKLRQSGFHGTILPLC